MQWYILVEPSILSFGIRFSGIGAEILLTWVFQAAIARQTHGQMPF